MKRTRRQTTGSTRDDDRAVSDVLAFILVFGIILSSVALLATVGFQSMRDYQEGEQLRNAERAMEALAVNFDSVLRQDGVEKRYGELSLREGTVSTGSSGTNLTILVDGNELSGNAGNVTADPIDLGEFTYETGDTTIAYEGGGVVRAGETGSAVVKRPQLTCRPESDTVVISVIAVDASDRSILSSDGIGVTMTERQRETQIEDGVTNVSVRLDTTYERAWNASLQRSGWETTGSASGDILATCEDTGSYQVDRVVITVVEADVNY
ncbi:hypothetical protein [Natrinema sp. 1APR25-10V2]|uniref:DUF7289 family protein n=1 Tax=Natrinema sp. 1APR25-10V2 TaxID=2951081 RepID=UPI002876ACFD|nr:hypothetical protein [Natrinema sp. 1APR25-10V2]MDS0474132.1 hypothetical protein [Natrinema sp. 1APR25-10V2]